MNEVKKRGRKKESKKGDENVCRCSFAFRKRKKVRFFFLKPERNES